MFDECSGPNQTFEIESDWLEHERWQHNLSWSCNGFNRHSPITFRSRADFRTHFETFHPGDFSPSDVDKHVQVSATPSNELFCQCPFCDFAILGGESAKGQDTSDVSLKWSINPINENNVRTPLLRCPQSQHCSKSCICRVVAVYKKTEDAQDQEIFNSSVDLPLMVF